MKPKYPDVVVDLVGEDGNAFYILGRVKKALRKAGISDDEQQKYYSEATAGNYDNLLQVTQKWVTVE